MADFTPQMQRIEQRLDEYLGEKPSAEAPASIAQTIAKDFPTAEDDVESYLRPLWQSVTKLAQGASYGHPAQDKLVNMVSEVMLLPDDQEIRIWGDPSLDPKFHPADGRHTKEKNWKELPLLGAEFREQINGPESADDETEQAKITRSWINFHAFAARLNGKGVTDWWDIPLWMLRQGLEEDLSTAPKLHDCHIMTAAQIVEHSGAIMLATKVIPTEKLDDTEKRMFAPGSLFKGEAGYTPERWTFWARRLREEAEKCSSDEVKNAALRAARLMEVWFDRSTAGQS
ncbi:hypothetical protein PG993_009424 [Apiospora rasikravindrae]|uniref:Uncharacterized protein n=1 Tax=Apiospora rasikravindrae TaxID=990691 RepID=A0ABR1SL51_9PEZI